MSESLPGNRMLVEVWTDIICPWCGVGERHFSEALERFEHKDAVDVVLRAYRLGPGKKPETMNDMLVRKYEMSQQEIAEGLAKMEATAAEAGLRYRLSGSWSCDTTDAHRLVKLAARSGKSAAMYKRLFTAAMSECEPVYDHATLARLAGEVGLEAQSVAALLAGDDFREEVEADHAAMKKHGGRAVPFYLMNGTHDYQGALSVEVFLSALKKTWEEDKDDSDDNGGAEAQGGAGGMVCGPDGCVLPAS